MAESAAGAVDGLPPWERSSAAPGQPDPLSEPSDEIAERRRPRAPRRRVWFGELIQRSWRPIRKRGLYPFVLAAAVLGPTSLLAAGLETWLGLPGNFVLVSVLMAGFLVYTTVLVGDGVAGDLSSAESVGGALTKTDAAFSSIVAAGALIGLLVAAGLHLRLLPGFLILGVTALTAPAAAREGLGGFTSLRRGFVLAQRNLVGHLALGVAVGGLAAAVYVVAAFLFSPLPAFFDLLAAVTTTAVLAAPFVAVIFASAYDLRERGARIIVRPRSGSAATHVARATGRAVETTVAALAGQRPRRRVSYIPTRRPTNGLPRYSPEAATMTVNRAAADAARGGYGSLDGPSHADTPTIH